MSSTSSSAAGMMNAAASKSTGAKKVAKKDAPAAAAAAVAAPAAAPAAAPVAAAAPKAKKAAKEAPAAPAPAPVVVASTPVEAAVNPAGPTTTLDEDLKTVTTSLTTLRDTVAGLLAQVKRLDKRVHREIKDARKRKRRSKPEEGAEVKARTPSIFERPVQVTDDLCVFLGKPKGTQMSRSEVTKAVNNYVKEKNLKNKHDITPDAALKKLLALPEGTSLTYFNLQKYLNPHYVKATTA